MSLSRIALNQQQIEAINWRNLQSLRTGLSDLICEPSEVTSEQLQKMIYSQGFPEEARFDEQGNLYEENFYVSLQQRMETAIASESIAVRCGVVIDNSFLRSFPTMAGSYRKEQIGEIDRFAVTMLKLGEPVLVYGQDESGLWSFVRSRQAIGWMLSERIAWETDFFRWRQYCTNRMQAVVTDSCFTLDYTDFDGISQSKNLFMGTCLALYDTTRDTFLVGLPVKDRRGNLANIQLVLRRNGSLVPGNLPLSAQNIISQAKKMLGEPYGWGGTGYHRDCTSLVGDVFSTFGLQFPRNSTQQLQMFGVERLPEKREQRYQFISALMPGAVLYFPGHAMLYLGRRGQELEILHSVYALGLPAADRIIPHKLRRVITGSLRQQRVNGECLLDALTACWAPEHQKQQL